MSLIILAAVWIKRVLWDPNNFISQLPIYLDATWMVYSIYLQWLMIQIS